MIQLVGGGWWVVGGGWLVVGGWWLVVSEWFYLDHLCKAKYFVPFLNFQV
jgi:hypothetical protein